MLFREGRKLIKAGKLEAGCAKLAASERLEPSVGTLLNLGACRERLGRHASAWAAFKKAEALARRIGGDDRRRAEAARRAKRLEPRLSHLVIEVPDRVEGLIVRRDGDVVDAASWSTAVPLDADTYTIEVEAPGHRPWRTEVALGIKVKREVVVVPPLERLPVVRAPAPAMDDAIATDPVSPIVTPVAVTEHRRPGTWTTARKVSAGLVVLGAGALGGGVYFGLRASDLERRADLICPLALCDDAEGLELNSDAREAARRANLMYAAGGVVVATAVVTWLLGGPDDETVVAPTMGDGRVGVSLGGRF